MREKSKGSSGAWVNDGAMVPPGARSGIGLVWELLRETLEGIWWEISPGKSLGEEELGFYASVDHSQLLEKNA